MIEWFNCSAALFLYARHIERYDGVHFLSDGINVLSLSVVAAIRYPLNIMMYSRSLSVNVLFILWHVNNGYARTYYFDIKGD